MIRSIRYSENITPKTSSICQQQRTAPAGLCAELKFSSAVGIPLSRRNGVKHQCASGPMEHYEKHRFYSACSQWNGTSSQAGSHVLSIASYDSPLTQLRRGRSISPPT